MRVELEKPSGASSRSRESAPAKGVVNCARPSQDVPIQTIPVGAVATGIVPSRKWICVSTPVEKRTVSSQYTYTVDFSFHKSEANSKLRTNIAIMYIEYQTFWSIPFATPRHHVVIMS